MDVAPGSHADNVLAIEIPVTVTVGSGSISLGEVLELVPGLVLKLDQRCDQSLRIDAAGQRVGSGTAVKIGERLGVKIQLP